MKLNLLAPLLFAAVLLAPALAQGPAAEGWKSKPSELSELL